METDPRHLAIRDFSYLLPENRIAQHPLTERDKSKLLFWNNGTISNHKFSAIPELLPAETLLVFNNTRVIHARFLFTKTTGSTIEIFCLEPLTPYTRFEDALNVNRSCTWLCMVGNLKRWKEPNLVMQFFCNGIKDHLQAELLDKEGENCEVRFTWNSSATFGQVMEAIGLLPLPPYLNRAADEADEDRYQTVYASPLGSVAAPTAGLHFTEDTLSALHQKKIHTAFVTLHVGAGTFKPVKAERMDEHLMHKEKITVPIGTIRELVNKKNRKVIAAGTTALRTLESLYWLGQKAAKKRLSPDAVVDQWEPYENAGTADSHKTLLHLLHYMEKHNLQQLEAQTRLLIAPGYTFRIVDGLITNFHQPESTLLLLVAAFAGEEWRKIYEHAMENNYRFLSYGDSSLLMRT